MSFFYDNHCAIADKCISYFYFIHISFFFQNMLTVRYFLALRSPSYWCRQTCLTLSTASFTKLDLAMMRFVDSKQYDKALDLFENRSATRTNVSNNMAIKACTELQDHRRGIDIIKQLPSHSFKNYFIQTSLIRFYSKLISLIDHTRIQTPN